MTLRTPIAFLAGAIAASLIAAAAFRAGQPLDSTFTYQGQLRNAGQLVNGPVDVRFTLWDSDVGGTQIGTANSFNNYPLADGRFALGLNFGAGAFNGDQRWVQVEFRSPAGAGQYLTLNPRDKINATPYALYALNGVESQWSYNPKTQALSTAVGKVGIGTSTPTAALEVVGAGGDDAVKLPAGSIGVHELGEGLLSAGRLSQQLQIQSPQDATVAHRAFQTTTSSVLVLHGSASGRGGSCGGHIDIRVDGEVVFGRGWYSIGTTFSEFQWDDVNVAVPLNPGTHDIAFSFSLCGPWSDAVYGVSIELVAITAPRSIEFTTP